MNNFKKKALRIVSIILALICCLSLFTPIASAEGSLYIGCYLAGMTAGNNGQVTITFQITGTETMDQIGAISIALYKDGKEVKTYSYTSTSGMMAYNTYVHGNEYTYNGVVGSSYFAYIMFQAGKNGDWDNRTAQTKTVVAKN